MDTTRTVDYIVEFSIDALIKEYSWFSSVSTFYLEHRLVLDQKLIFRSIRMSFYGLNRDIDIRLRYVPSRRSSEMDISRNKDKQCYLTVTFLAIEKHSDLQTRYLKSVYTNYANNLFVLKCGVSQLNKL